jgi:hypothetical protein
MAERGSLVKSSLSAGDLSVVLEELYTVRTHWYFLGLKLGIKSDLLDDIGVRCSNKPKDCFCDTLKKYLNTVTPSWRVLVEALRSPTVDQPQLAEEVEKKYCPVLRQDTQDALVDESLQNSQDSSLPLSPPVSGVMSETENELHTFAMQISTSSALSTDEPHLPKHYGCGCGECSFASFCEKGCPKPSLSMSSFSYLNIKGLDDTQKEILTGRLYREFEVIKTNFGSLVYKTCNSFVQQNITVQEFVSLLGGVDAFLPTMRKTPLLCIEKLQAAETIEQVFDMLRRYVSFFSYHIIEYIIDELGTQQDKENLHGYTDKLTEFSRRSIFECPTYSLTRKDQANLVVKLEGVNLERYTLIHLAAFKSRISDIIKVTKYTLRLCTVEEGCLQLTFQMPHFVKEVIFPLADCQKASLKVEGVAHLTCEDYKCLLEEYVPDVVSEEIFLPEECVQPDMGQQSGLLEGGEESGAQYKVSDPDEPDTEMADSVLSVGYIPIEMADSLFSGDHKEMASMQLYEIPKGMTDSQVSEVSVKLGALLNSSCYEGQTDQLKQQLQEVSQNRQLPLECVINYPIKHYNDRTCVHLAASNGLWECLEELLNSGGNPNATSSAADFCQV